MKELAREFAPTVIFAIIVTTMIGMTMRGVNQLHRTNGVEHAEVIGKLNLVDYRLGKVEESVNIHMQDSTIHIQPLATITDECNDGS